MPETEKSVQEDAKATCMTCANRSVKMKVDSTGTYTMSYCPEDGNKEVDENDRACDRYARRTSKECP